MLNLFKAIKAEIQTEQLTVQGEMLFGEENNYFDLDRLYQKAKKIATPVLCFRWNQGYPYIEKFLRNDNHHWITIVRHPIDRALSDYRAFNESFENSLKYTTKLCDYFDIKK